MIDADLQGPHPPRLRPWKTAFFVAVVVLVSTLAIIVWSSPLRAETPWRGLSQPVFQSLGVEAGLPNSVTVAIAQDPSGFLWVGTTAGLARWDGYGFRLFGVNPRVPDLPDNFVQALHTDAGGRLWIGTAAGGAARYDPERDAFIPMPLADIANGRVEIRAFADDGGGGLWIATDHGLYHLDRPDAVARLQPDTGAWKNVLSLLRDRSGVLWVGTSHGLYRAGAGGGFQPVSLAHDPAVFDEAVMSLVQDSAGRVWVGTFSAGVFVVDQTGSRPSHINGLAHDPQHDAAPGVTGIATLDVEHMIEARPGEIWLGTPGQGVVVVDEATGAVRTIRHDPVRPSSLAGDLVSYFYKDRDGMIWIATDHGLSFAAGTSAAFDTLFSRDGVGPSEQANSIAGPNITSVLAASDGRVWLGLEQGGIDIVDTVLQTITRLPANDALSGVIVSHLAELAGQGAFIASRNGLFHADIQGRTVLPVDAGGGSPADPAPTIAASGDVLWLPQHRQLFAFKPAASAPSQPVISLGRLFSPRVSAILPDGQHRLWLGTWDGLNLLDPSTGRLEGVRSDPAAPDGLWPGMITTLLKDHAGRLWVGTVGGGINILTGRKAGGGMIFRHLGPDEGLPNLSVDTMLMAPDGHVWASTDDGLAEIDPGDLQIRAFHLADGVAIPGYWVDSGTVTQAGDLVFGGAGGVTVVHPGALPRLRPPPRLVVTDVRIGGRPVASARLNMSGTVAPITIAPGAGALAVAFSALDYANPGRDQYAYRLDGLDASWTTIDPTRRLAAYTNLQPGTYSLLLRATVAGREVQLAIPIVVLPAWYQTIAARAAFAALCILAIGGLMWMSTLVQRQRQRELEDLVARRTGELRSSNASLSEAVETLGQLRTLGQEITANLNIDVVLTILHRSIVRLIKARAFAVYLVEDEESAPVWCFGTRDGQRLASAPKVQTQAAIVARAIIGRCEEIEPETGNEASVLCAPLIVLDRVIGAITITSRRIDGFTERERVVFRTLCSYGAIALSNADTLLRLADMHARLEQIAYSDSLTDLPNRRAFNERVDDFIARGARQSGRFALLLIDLDDFKNVNDAYGHDIGDTLLVETASRLRLIVREEDEVLRIGGDEFAVLLDAVDDTLAPRELCRRIGEEFAAGILIDGRRIASHVSIGVAMFPGDAATQERLYKAADIALYAAKRAGGGRAVFFEPALNAAELSNRQMKHDLAEAIQRDEFSVFYQPLYSTRDRSLRGFEALLRWLHPVRGWLGPATFIAIAEESGLISALGRMVLENAVATARRLQRGGTPCLVSVNLSVHHLAEGSVAEFVTALLRNAGVSGHAICIEVTESTLMNEAALAEIHRLKGLGLKISIDDFGTGYSSLAYLSALPVDTVKIDQRFVTPLGSDTRAARFFCAIVDLAHTLGLRTIAEGCETEAQFAVIKASGCNDVQGWLFARAMDPDTLQEFLAAPGSRAASEGATAPAGHGAEAQA